MIDKFLNEAECYKILKKYGIKTATYDFITQPGIKSDFFKEGEAVVFKAVVDDVWHKSDQGLMQFGSYSDGLLDETYHRFYNLLPDPQNWRGLLTCKKIQFKTGILPTELLLSIKNDPSCGPVITLGFGGIYTELWGKELSAGVLTFNPDFTSAKQAAGQLSEHLLGKILLGEIRQGEVFVEKRTIEKFLTTVWKLAQNLQKEKISLIEINPLVINLDGQFVALDGVGEKLSGTTRIEQNKNVWPQPELSAKMQRALFQPQTFLVAGVSSKKKGFGNIILDNFKDSLLPSQNILVLKKDCPEFEGYKTIAALSYLTRPVDALILAVPALSAIEMIRQVCDLGLARIVYLVAGGIGDGADHTGLKDQLLQILAAAPPEKRPRVIGPNSLGIILSPQKINTLFIPENKLPVRFSPTGNLGFIAQSGAFFITRISNNELLPIRFGFCIGNQIDLSATDLVRGMAGDKQIDVIALYLEGAPQGDALSLAMSIKKISIDKKVIIYRGGRSPAGMKAASGHTGALASDYKIEKNLLQAAGAIVCENFNDFENMLAWYCAYPRFKKVGFKSIAVISNAGYESVASADGLGNLLADFSEGTKARLKTTLEEFNLSAIVSANNPLDVTPMASDDVYFECASICLNAPETGLLILGVVPLSVMIETVDEQAIRKNVQRLKGLVKQAQKPLAVVVDSGHLYKKMKDIYKENGIPLFGSIQDVFAFINPQ
jgi:acyl-CoA synthetase (NDP forming)